MRRVGAFEAKTHFSRLLAEVEQKRMRIVIQRRGRDVAVLAPCSDVVVGSEGSVASVLNRLREIRATQEESGGRVNAKELIAEGRKR